MSIINDALKKTEKYKVRYPDKAIKDASLLKRRLLPLAGLSLVAFVVAILAISYFKRPPEVIVADYAAPVVSERQVFEEAIPEIELSEEVFAARAVDIEPAEARAGFNLSGILYDQQKPFAIINTQVVEEGAFIDQAKILEIQPGYVKIAHQGEEIILKIK
jgi:hypothetical protein